MKKGNHNVKQLCMTVLVEEDHQLNGKRLGKTLMETACGPNKGSIADEQCGCRKCHRAIEVVLNARLVDDILRTKTLPAIVCSNDAKSCFDCIVHSIFSICMRRLGAHANPVKSCVRTLQSLHHHMRTAFGDSD